MDNPKKLPELPSELLELIVKHLDVVAFCSFGVVCKTWYEIYDWSKEDFLESQAPMAILMSSSVKHMCYLFDMANGNTKKFKFLNLFKKFFIGCSAGYMIIEDMNHQISIVNPLTGHELNCHTPSFTLKGESLYDRIILVSTSSSESDVILVICNSKHEIQVFHSRKKQWFTSLYFGAPWVDIAIFKEQVYVVTNNAQIGKLRMKESNSTNKVFSWMTVKNTPNVNSQDLKLVVSNNQLLMVDFVPDQHLNIHKIDFDSVKWVKVDKLNDQALFLGKRWDSSIRKSSKWGGQSNCVYYLETQSTMCCVYSMEAKLIHKFLLMENSTCSRQQSLGWYYPHQCMMVDYHMDSERT
ncbi:uncharacterized protein LOC113855614 [Abrus precatorius]|uniref:Uncharacterized protein LOC113855614 n=1 Tax=Abrus precatorius TaxID=3816 RepID=A0A8B8KH07_ABRPR|nr:uncharacterized protein LOC113855614 [Abrus precatorius]